MGNCSVTPQVMGAGLYPCQLFDPLPSVAKPRDPTPCEENLVGQVNYRLTVETAALSVVLV